MSLPTPLAETLEPETRNTKCQHITQCGQNTSLQASAVHHYGYREQQLTRYKVSEPGQVANAIAMEVRGKHGLLRQIVRKGDCELA